ncbi:hypothetical protein EV646_10570 [Kribbella antiqua]|uniref:Uncharacterized protein n=1 Tax=Kribbella antiqua TaxID=2512217 RepID=A0A4R2ITP4_9ACTN|nr:hypothetical protein [Kribbella antiqua]TCO47518.1 hypothetical protein EV646_10570 [Kribbella antiqua]
MPDDFRPSPIFGWGCGSFLASVALGAIAWYVAYRLNPCDCDGDPDAEFYWLMNTFPAGLITFLIIQVVFAVVIVRNHKNRR